MSKTSNNLPVVISQGKMGRPRVVGATTTTTSFQADAGNHEMIRHISQKRTTREGRPVTMNEVYRKGFKALLKNPVMLKALEGALKAKLAADASITA